MSPRGAHPFLLTPSVANRVLVPLLSMRGPAAPETASAAEAYPAGRSRS